MTKKNDILGKYIDLKYFNRLRDAVIQHGNINIQKFTNFFGILPGNTYFRNFLKDQGQNYIGSNSFVKILEKCGYEIKVVIIKKTDKSIHKIIEDKNDESFLSICNTFDSKAKEFKKKVVMKTDKKPINNYNLINDSILGGNDSIEDIFDIDLEISDGTFQDISELS